MAPPRRISPEIEQEIRERYEAGGQAGRTGVIAREFTERLGLVVSDDLVRSAVRRSGGTLRARGGQKGLPRSVAAPVPSVPSETGPTAQEVAEENQDGALSA